jgi:hypothetical protein
MPTNDAIKIQIAGLARRLRSAEEQLHDLCWIARRHADLGDGRISAGQVEASASSVLGDLDGAHRRLHLITGQVEVADWESAA